MSGFDPIFDDPSFDHRWQRESWQRERDQVRATVNDGKTLEDPRRIFSPQDLSRLESKRDSVIERFAALVCHGEKTRVQECDYRKEATCLERDSKGCPKRILEFERRIKGDLPDTARTLEGYGIPIPWARMLGAGDYQRTEALEAADRWWGVKPRRPCLVLLGGTGIGKSFAAAYLVSRHAGRFVDVGEFQRNARNAEYVRCLRFPLLLAIDDLGSEAIGGFDDWEGAFSAIFRQRIDSGMATILTTNASLDAIKRYGDRFIDRLKDAQLTQVGGESMRGK
jgi:DNA replication protein DnaC